MSVPKVAIVGRPNVGKSSLFNWLVGRRVAIVDPTAGVTRDRVNSILEHQGVAFDLTDTGGMGIEDRDGLTHDVERQIALALHEADLILFLLDAHTGITDLDELVDRKLRGLNKPVLAVVNKCDDEDLARQGTSFYRLGRDLLFVSVTTGRGKAELLDQLVYALPVGLGDPRGKAEPEMKVAVVGKRNAGKSTFINQLAKSERVIVSEIPGTTRDSVDVRFELNDKVFLAIDTAGFRKRKSLADSIEFYSFARAQRTVRRADVVLHFLDAPTEISKVDRQLVTYVLDQHKPCIFVVNKWDLLKDIPTERFDEYIDDVFPNLRFAPRIFITAKTGKNVQRVIELAADLWEQARFRVPTADLNRVLRDAVSRQPPPMARNRRPKIYFASQVAVAPPTFVIFCNDPKLFGSNYERYLTNVLRDTFPFPEVPLKITFRRRTSRPREEDGRYEKPERVHAQEALPAEEVVEVTPDEELDRLADAVEFDEADVWPDDVEEEE